MSYKQTEPGTRAKREPVDAKMLYETFVEAIGAIPEWHKVRPKGQAGWEACANACLREIERLREIASAAREFEYFMGLFPEFVADMGGADKQKALRTALAALEDK